MAGRARRRTPRLGKYAPSGNEWTTRANRATRSHVTSTPRTGSSAARITAASNKPHRVRSSPQPCRRSRKPSVLAFDGVADLVVAVLAVGVDQQSTSVRQRHRPQCLVGESGGFASGGQRLVGAVRDELA